tara:strand:+ start:15174 stop:15512 length:339 start_codon:yes stop_codon:yes gene_type:complete
MSRYGSRNKKKSDISQYREKITKSENKRVEHYTTPKLPGIKYEDIVNNLRIQQHVWKSQDRFYKLAGEYYNDPTVWWVIANFNRKPTDAEVSVGDVVYVPFPLERAIALLGH